LIKECQAEHFPEIKKTEFPFRLLTATYGIADARTPVIRRNDYESCTVEYVYDGRGYLETNDSSCAPLKDSVYILHKHSTHKYWPERSAPWKKIFFVADGELMEYLFRIYRLDKVYHIPDCPQLKKYFEEMMRLRHGKGTIHSQAAIVFHRFLEEADTLIHGQAENIPKDVLELRIYLDNSIEEKANLEDFCGKIHRSSAYMIRQFKSFFGFTPYDYLMKKRIETAKLLLHHSSLSIKEIAAHLKFSDQFYFSNYFKRKTGISPQKYKKGERIPAL